MKNQRELFHAVCDECNAPMNEGYVISGGEHYYCTDECLHKNITEEEWEEICTDDSDSYWTEWEDDEEYANYEIIDGQVIEL